MGLSGRLEEEGGDVDRASGKVEMKRRRGCLAGAEGHYLQRVGLRWRETRVNDRADLTRAHERILKNQN